MKNPITLTFIATFFVTILFIRKSFTFILKTLQSSEENTFENLGHDAKHRNKLIVAYRILWFLHMHWSNVDSLKFVWMNTIFNTAGTHV